jgi:N-acetylglutamate synthase-like GNAT family acetyltransferase
MNAAMPVSKPGPRDPHAPARRAAAVAASPIKPARAADAPAIAALLSAAELPPAGLAAHLAHFIVARDAQGAVIGAVGAEVCGPDALLRSLVVAPEARGAGLGDALLAALEERAAAWGVQRWWLLTTTAETFFTARGFVVTERAAAPAAIRATGQFKGGCGSSAVCLTRARSGART